MSKDDVKKLQEARDLIYKAADLIEEAGYVTLMSIVIAKAAMISEMLDDEEES